MSDTYAAVNPNEQVRTARCILHFHVDVFDKGDTFVIYPAKTGSLPKYYSLILVINRK